MVRGIAEVSWLIENLFKFIEHVYRMQGLEKMVSVNKKENRQELNLF